MSNSTRSVTTSRESSGASALPGRERYRRNIKTLISSTTGRDTTFSKRTGQRLEIVPRQDPATLNAGAALDVTVWFDGRPLKGALVKFWNRSGPELVALSARTDAAGKASMVLSQSGTWMVSVVQMVPAQGTSEFDWDSYWGNLTFEVRAPARADAQRR